MEMEMECDRTPDLQQSKSLLIKLSKNLWEFAQICSQVIVDLGLKNKNN